MKPNLAGCTELKKGIIAYLVKITLINGDILTISSSDIDINFNGDTYIRKYGIEFDEFSSSVGLEIDESKITLHTHDDLTIQGKSLPVFCRFGGFNGAAFIIYRARYERTVHLFEGRISSALPNELSVELSVKSYTELLDRPMPDIVIAPLCTHTVYDTGCKAIKDNFSINTVVLSNSNLLTLITSLTQPNGYFQYGTIKFISGINAGVERTVRAFSSGVFELSYPLENIPAVGDQFKASAGCDGSSSVCFNRFNNNIDNRLSFDFVPTPEDAI
jgi:uncharacterized phage protein (TIGR02218 family)